VQIRTIRVIRGKLLLEVVLAPNPQPDEPLGNTSPLPLIPQPTEVLMAVDPVCNMEVDEETAPGHTVYDGMDFYFCSLTCQQKFEHDPGQYVDVEAA
jgi:YHS domain-containing protein